jgi:hypothetical protein
MKRAARARACVRARSPPHQGVVADERDGQQREGQREEQQHHHHELGPGGGGGRGWRAGTWHGGAGRGCGMPPVVLAMSAATKVSGAAGGGPRHPRRLLLPAYQGKGKGVSEICCGHRVDGQVVSRGSARSSRMSRPGGADNLPPSHIPHFPSSPCGTARSRSSTLTAAAHRHGRGGWCERQGRRKVWRPGCKGIKVASQGLRRPGVHLSMSDRAYKQAAPGRHARGWGPASPGRPPPFGGRPAPAATWPPRAVGPSGLGCVTMGPCGVCKKAVQAVSAREGRQEPPRVLKELRWPWVGPSARGRPHICDVVSAAAGVDGAREALCPAVDARPCQGAGPARGNTRQAHPLVLVVGAIVGASVGRGPTKAHGGGPTVSGLARRTPVPAKTPTKHRTRLHSFTLPWP